MCHFKYSHENNVPRKEAGAAAKAKPWLSSECIPQRHRRIHTTATVQAVLALTLTPEHKLTESIAGIKNLQCKA